ncbi:MAG: hypothetical protein AAGU26_10545 [bacterium]
MIRHITVELAFPGESVWTDVSSLVRYNSWSIDEAAFSTEKRSAIDKFSCSLKYNSTVLGKLRAADARIWIRVKNALDNSALFFGVIEPSVSNETSDHVGDISLDAVDNSWRLDEKVSTTRQLPALVTDPGFKLWDAVDPEHSIAHVMLADAGYTAAEIGSSISVAYTIQSFNAIKDESTYRDLLDVLFMEFGYVIHPDASGVLNLVLWRPTAPAIELGPNDLSTVIPFKFENRADYRDCAKVTWSELEILHNVLVYRENLPVDSDGTFTGEAIAAGDYFPKDSDIEDVFQGYVQNWLDKPYLARETRLANKDLTLVATSGAVVEFEADSGVVIDTSVFESHKAKIRFKNESAETKSIRIFEIYADALIRKKIATEKALPLGTEKNAREYASQYIFTKVSAQALATALAEDVHAEEQYYFGSNQLLALGARIKLIEARNGTSVYAVLTRRKRSSSKAVIEYEAIQLLTIESISIHSEMQTLSSIWPVATPQDIAVALSDTSKVFYTEPIGPYSIGDLWINDGALYQSTADRAKGNYVPSDWIWCIRSNLTVIIQSSNGDKFKPGQSTSTILTPFLFKNGIDVTASYPDSSFKWIRTSFFPQSPPNDDATWNANHLSGYRTVEVTTDSIYARATYTLEIVE